MKNLLPIAGILIGTLSFNAQAQTIVETIPTDKNAVLEDFTGIRCGFCPLGHEIAEKMLDDNPGRAVVIATHGGSYAEPRTLGEPDFTTPFAPALIQVSDVAGYPAGTVNRRIFPGRSQRNGSAMSRGSWAISADEVMTEPSVANIGAVAHIDPSTRELTIDIEVYYTGDGSSNNSINVALLQSGLTGPQSGGGMGDNYVQNHVLRNYLTGQWGERVDASTQGALVTKQIKHTIPEYYGEWDADGDGKYESLRERQEAILSDMSVVIFLTEDARGEIITGIQVGMNPVGISENDNINNISLYPNPSQDVTTLQLGLNKTADVQVEVYNALGKKVANPFAGQVNGGVFKNIQLNTSNYPAGLYFVNIVSEGKVITEKLNVSH